MSLKDLTQEEIQELIAKAKARFGTGVKTSGKIIDAKYQILPYDSDKIESYEVFVKTFLSSFSFGTRNSSNYEKFPYDRRTFDKNILKRSSVGTGDNYSTRIKINKKILKRQEEFFEIEENMKKK